ncbi:hypothetical protein KUL49_16760 [Alteromonas sp. KUL49]|nr:hypothetical protein KUL49_16760 [Alteromonas sp. KUL49]
MQYFTGVISECAKDDKTAQIKSEIKRITRVSWSNVNHCPIAKRLKHNTFADITVQYYTINSVECKGQCNLIPNKQNGTLRCHFSLDIISLNITE